MKFSNKELGAFTATFSVVMLLALTSFNNLNAQCASNDPSSPEGVVPTMVPFPGGGPQCPGGYRVEDAVVGTGANVVVVNVDGIPGNDITLTITIDPTCGEVLSWSAAPNIVVDQVIAKGSTIQNIYDYTGINPRPSTDGYLHSPVNASGKYAAFSHIDLCYHYRVSVSKTAEASFTRQHKWSISKSCNGPASLTLSTGQSYSYPFSWTATSNSYRDSDWQVNGSITIANNTIYSATITGMSDVLSGGESVDCGLSFPLTLLPRQSVSCDYNVPLDAPYDGTNTVTVETSTPNVEGNSAAADFAFGNPTTTLDDCITVTDDCTTPSTVCLAQSPYTTNYTCPISYGECGSYTYTNAVSFSTDDTQTTGSASCSVAVNIPCGGGCTLTIGYWKTHSSYGPAPYDETWAQIGENTTFFLSGISYYQTLWTPPAGNPYWILAQQYIAAKLNILNGASVPASVQTAFNQATNLFNTYTPAQVASASKAIKKQFTDLGALLDNYNNGITGPGHCSERSFDQTPETALADNAGFSIFPNPAADKVQVDLSNFMDKAVSIELYNQLGQMVVEQHLDKVESPIFQLRFNQGLSDGYYNLSIVVANKRLSKSLIIQH